MFDLQFKKSIIYIHNYYSDNNYSNDDFLKMIDECFNIKKTTFYNWMNDENIINAEQIYENNNKLITKAVETYIVNLYNTNDKMGIKITKKKIKEHFKYTLSRKDISYVLYKNKIKCKNIKPIDIYNENKKYKKQKKDFILINDEQSNFILDNKNEKPKNIVKLFNDKYNNCIHEKQIVDIMNKNKIETKSFFKSSPSIINFILKLIDEDKTNTVKQIKDLIFNEFKTKISVQLIYNILKKNNYVYKKFKFNNNPYSISDQVNQFKKIIEIHNEKNINDCVSIDEISFVLGSKPNNGWFKKNEINEIKCNSKKIIRERYSLLVASSNNKILLYDMCKKGVCQVTQRIKYYFIK